MPFKLIKGTYHVVHYSPDGDSIRFQPDDVALVKSLSGSAPRINPRNHVQLRIEGIDALETHFSPPSGGGAFHQPLELAHAATDKLLRYVGITDVQWDSTHLTVLSAKDGTRGYILARTVEKNGRPVAFVYSGSPRETDGANVLLDSRRLKDSYNYLALAAGLVYPTYYRGLFDDLRETLTDATERARNSAVGIYTIDRTNAGFDAVSLESITNRYAILPKLFRRLSEYMVNYGTAVGFKTKMEESREPVLDLIKSNFTHFDTFIDEKKGKSKVRLTTRVETLVFDESPARPSDTFGHLMTISGAPRALVL